MHLIEGFLPLPHCALWSVASLPALVDGTRVYRQRLDSAPSLRFTLAAVAAYALVLSTIHVPMLGGSSAHPTGIAVGVLLMGPRLMAIAVFAVLLLQALLLAHGGISTLGANFLAMGVAGTWATFFAHRAMRRLSAAAAVFTATVLGCLATFMFTMLQLAMALPDPLLVSVTRLGGVFLVSELPLAVLEAMLTVFVVRSLPANAFLRERTGAAC